MTITDTEAVAALNALLDLDPTDHGARGQLADALDDAGEWELAEGTRALVELGKYPQTWEHGDDGWTVAKIKIGWSWWSGTPKTLIKEPDLLIEDWWLLISEGIDYEGIAKDYSTRRDAEYAAARAFMRLPNERRAELLRQEVSTC